MQKEPIPIEVSFPDKGFEKFLCLWLLLGETYNIIVDIGPSSTIKAVINELKRLGVERIDYVLLTHIHLDHSGGLGDFLKQYPMAKVICHKKAISHLINPERLWEGSKKALGNIAFMYGKPVPIHENHLIPHDHAKIDGLHILETPGHASHHISFIYHNRLFPGEACGNRFSYDNIDYLRPATPPPFYMDSFLNSVKILGKEKNMVMYLPHFGRIRDSHSHIDKFKSQVILWKDIVKGILSDYPDVTSEQCLKKILDNDPELKGFESLSHDIRKRELFFLKNSISGYLNYLRRDIADS